MTIDELKKGEHETVEYKLHIIEKWGTGIPRILKEAAEYGLREPELKDFGTSFRIDIFRKPFETDPFGVVQPQADDAEHQSSASNDAQHDAKGASSASSDLRQETIDLLLASLHEKDRNRAKLILNCMTRDSHMTAVQIGNEIGLSKATVQRAIDGLKAARIVSRRGSNNGGQWVIAQPPQAAIPTEKS